MRRFEFNLEKVRRLREHEEHERELELGEITSRCVRSQKEIRRRQEEKQRLLGGRSFATGGLAAYAAAEAYGQRLDREMGELRRELEELERERGEAQQRFMEASRKRKVLEKLKEKKLERHHREQRKEEQRELDEIGSAMRSGQRQ